MSSNLNIVIAGVPPGVKVGVFDERKKRGDPDRPILLEESRNPNYVVEKRIDASYAGAKVKVVIRSAGFLPIEFEDTIDRDIGLYHATLLIIDRVYSGTKSEIPGEWNSTAEHRKAEKIIQHRLKQLYTSTGEEL